MINLTQKEEDFIREKYIYKILLNDFGAECKKDCANKESRLYLTDIKWQKIEDCKTRCYVECSECKEYGWGSEFFTDIEVNNLNDFYIALQKDIQKFKDEELELTYKNPTYLDLEEFRRL